MRALSLSWLFPPLPWRTSTRASPSFPGAFLQSQPFRPAVIAAALAFQAQSKVVPQGIRKLGQRAAARVMRWLDDRREKLDADLLD